LDSVLIPPGLEPAGRKEEEQPSPEIKLPGLLERLEIFDFQAFRAVTVPPPAWPLIPLKQTVKPPAVNGTRRISADLGFQK
jgi:hypothetical protein